VVFIVKGKLPIENSLGFQTEIEDLHSKGCILEENLENTITGRSPHFPKSR